MYIEIVKIIHIVLFILVCACVWVISCKLIQMLPTFFYIWFSVQYFLQQLSSTTVKNTDVMVIISRPTHHPLNGANCITRLPVILPEGGEDVGNCVMNEVKEFVKICKMKMQVIGVVLLKLKN